MDKMKSKLLTSSTLPLRQEKTSTRRQGEPHVALVQYQEGSQPWLTCEPGGRMLRPAEVFDRVGLSRSSVYELIANGAFPPFVKLSARASGMPEAWLNCFVASRARDAVAWASR